MSYRCKKTKGLHHVCLRVADPVATKAFYQAALGAEVAAERGDIGQNNHGVLLDLGEGDLIEVFKGDAGLPQGIWQHIAVYAADIDASYQLALASGAKPHSAPRYHEILTHRGDLIQMKYAFVWAPGGELLEFIEDKMP